MNFSMIRGLVGNLSERTKLIAVAVIAFLLGIFFGGGSKITSNGRFVPLSSGQGDTTAILDTSNGQSWIIDPNDPHHYRKGAIPSSWF